MPPCTFPNCDCGRFSECRGNPDPAIRHAVSRARNPDKPATGANELLKQAKRALAALETPGDLTPEERTHLIEDLAQAVRELESADEAEPRRRLEALRTSVMRVAQTAQVEHPPIESERGWNRTCAAIMDKIEQVVRDRDAAIDLVGDTSRAFSSKPE